MEVAIVYLRCGYKPSDYESDADWETRLMMERSKAIVCPTAAYQLAGTKKVQQVLAAPNMVERFIEDSEAVRRIRATFADQYSLDLVIITFTY
jgi:glutathione synthase